jgi:hypothetical protein
VKHHHLNTDAFYVVSQFCEMEGKVFPYAEWQLCSWYKISFFFFVSQKYPFFSFYLPFFSSSIQSLSLEQNRHWCHLFIAVIRLCYVYYVSIYQYRLISITMRNSHQWSFPFSWNTVTTATILSLTSSVIYS